MAFFIVTITFAGKTQEQAIHADKVQEICDSKRKTLSKPTTKSEGCTQRKNAQNKEALAPRTQSIHFLQILK